MTTPDPTCTCVRCVSLVRDRKRRAQRRLMWRRISRLLMLRYYGQVPWYLEYFDKSRVVYQVFCRRT